ncbi:geranylgeranyl reductase family protein [bacterium]|nr:geranylgeranyl reductase family protein [bacterium]
MSYFVDKNICIACWGCLQICPVNAIVQNDKSAEIIPNICIDCGKCGNICPIGAIKIGIDTSNKILPDNNSDNLSYETVDKNFDIVIIGGGPAGLSAGYFAAKSGFSVAIVERRQKFGEPVACAEGISVEGLTKIFPANDEWISSKIEAVKIYTPSKRMLYIDHPDAGFVLDRPKFESALAKMNVELGVKIFQKYSVRKILGESEIDSILIENDDNLLELVGKYYIGADGIAGISSRWAFPEKILADEDFHSCAQVLLGSDEISGKPVAEFWWGKDIAPGGYIWVFPKGKNRANVGLGIVPKFGDGKCANDYLEQFLHTRFKNFRIVEHRDGIVPTTRRFSPLGRANLLLVGDCGKLTNAISGGGLDSALFSGKLAAETIADCKNCNFLKILNEYEKRWQKSNGRLLDIYAKLRKGVSRLTDSELEKIADILDKKLSGKVWYGLDIPAIVWEIVKSSPKLLSIAGKFFVNYF